MAMALYRWLADRYRKPVVDVVEEKVAGADSLKYMNGIIHPSFHLEGKNLKSNFNFVENILGQRMINEVNSEVLPSDAWLEILRRIPAADLLPLKAVCKAFHRLISDDFFTRLHIDHFTKAKRAILFLRDYGATRPRYSIHYDPDKRTISVWYDEPRFDVWCKKKSGGFPPHYHRFIDSYHGLRLVHICGRFLLFNPITRSHQFCILPNRCTFEMDYGCWKIAYDDVSKQYKVFGLRILPDGEADTVSVDVFNVHHRQPPRDMEWCPRGRRIVSLVENALVINGSVYWLIITRETLEGWETCIVSANVATEEVKTRTCSIIRPFTTRLIDDSNADFFAANGTFYQLVSCNMYINKPPVIKLSVLEGVESENPNPSWKMKHLIDTHPIASTPNYLSRAFGVFHDKVLIRMGLDSRCINRLFQYDMSSKEFEEITVASNHDKDIKHDEIPAFESGHIVEHIDSLIRLAVID